MAKGIREHGNAAIPAANAMPDLKVQLEKTVFYPGQRVSGVVTATVAQPAHVRGIRVRLVGVERVQVHYGRQTKWIKTPSVDQEVVLVGRDRLPDAGAVIVDTWDTILQRGTHAKLLPGEYVYPFSIPIPGHTPPTYTGKITAVDYRLEITVDRTLRRSRKQVIPLTVVPAVRELSAATVSLSTFSGKPSADGTKMENRLDVRLDRGEYAPGGVISGEYTAQIVSGGTLESLVITLRAKEETYARGGSGNEQWDVARLRISFENSRSGLQKGKFSLDIPDNLPPSISGRTFALTYGLDFRIAASEVPGLSLQADIDITSPPQQV